MKTNNEYTSIVNDILDNEKFDKIRYIEHHGITRYEHSIHVSYISYKIAKKLGLDYRQVARAGLLHDFFMSEERRTIKEKLISTFTHPKKALENAEKNFELSKREKNIIESHMFPISNIAPKSKEAWMVSLSDKIVAAFEGVARAKAQIGVWMLFLVNFIR